jgi:hypothetical protein
MSAITKEQYLARIAIALERIADSIEHKNLLDYGTQKVNYNE